MLNPSNAFTLINYDKQTNSANLLPQLGKNVSLPNKDHNYTIYNQRLVKELCAKREKALPFLDNFLKTTNDEKAVCEALYTIDRMCDLKVKGIDKMYGTLSRFNRTDSPNIQVLLAGIYRKTQVPDGFGPLVNMLVANTQKAPHPYFDPSEEIGGAILEYIKNYSSLNAYTKEKR